MGKTADHTTMQQLEVASNQPSGLQSKAETRNMSCILVVTSHTQPAKPVMEYVLNVADRLGSKILVACVNTRPLLQDTFRLLKPAVTASHTTINSFRMKAQSRGIEFECVNDTGKIGKVINRLCHIVKRVEFVVVDQGINMEEATAGSPVPVFSVVCNEPHPAQVKRSRHMQTPFHGENRMKATSRRTYFAKTLVFGAMTAALYGAVFAYQEAIMHYWTKGGIYALLPVATVFVFSYAHGSFTGNFWSALGIEGSKVSAAKQKAPQATTADKATRRPDTRPRVQVNA